jgi:tetratricopeptide (TPR) repeat protein
LAAGLTARRFFFEAPYYLNMNASKENLIGEAAQLRAAGRYAESAAAYERLLSLWPDLPESWFNLGLMQSKCGRFTEALASYQRAIDHGVSMPEEVHLNRGVILSDHLRRDVAAEAELKSAIALNPCYLPALMNLANLQEDRGLRAEAAALYERILSLNPSSWEALARYAGIQRPKSADDPVISRLRVALARPGVSPADQASLGFALGRALDFCGAYDEAFSVYAGANYHSRVSATALPYDAARQERLVDAIMAAFPVQQSAPVLKSPLFICGMFRSGSTLVEQVLSGHPAVTAGGELDLLPRYVGARLAPFPESMANTNAAALHGIAEDYATSVAQLFPGADIVTDKRPDNFLYIGLVKALFPKAKFIHTVRHPLDNCLSIFFLHLDHNLSYALDLADVGHHYRQYSRLMKYWESLFGDDIFRFDYDAFVRDPKATLARLLRFCDLDWDDACLEFHQRSAVVKTASVWQVREPLYARASGRWRHYEAHIAPLRTYLADLLPEAQANE